MEDILLDDNGNFILAADGDVETVVDLECLIQDVKHLLLTFPADLWQHREYGVGIQAWNQAEDNELNRLELQQAIRLGLSRDSRIDSQSIKVTIASWKRDAVTVTITFLPVATALDSDGEIPEEQAAIVLTISQNGISFEGAAA